MKNLIITGGLGFIGKNIARYISASHDYDKLYIVDKNTRVSDIGYFRKYLASDFELIQSCISEIKIEEYGSSIDIINFAAESHVDESFINAVNFTDQNVLKTHIFLENIRLSKVDCRLIHISTDEVYGGSMMVPCTELANFAPSNPYSASKAAADLLVQTYAQCYGLNIAIIRANNLYGDYQNIEKLIPKAIYMASNEEPFMLHGSGEQTRHFLHCKDFLTAILTIMKNWYSVEKKIFNIAADTEQSVVSLVRKIYTSFELDTQKFVKFGPDRPFNDQQYLINDSKLRELGWAPAIDFETELNQIIEHRRIFIS